MCLEGWQLDAAAQISTETATINVNETDVDDDPFESDDSEELEDDETVVDDEW